MYRMPPRKIVKPVREFQRTRPFADEGTIKTQDSNYKAYEDKVNQRNCVRPYLYLPSVGSSTIKSLSFASGFNPATSIGIEWIGTFNLTGNFTSGSARVTNTNTTSFSAGSALDDSNNVIPTGTTVLAIIDSTTFDMSASATHAFNNHSFTVTDSTVTAGSAANGIWQFYLNLFPDFELPGGYGILGSLGDQAGTVTVQIDIIDGAQAVLSSAVLSASYDIHQQFLNANSMTYSVGTQFVGTEQLTTWNGIKVTVSCTNTNLDELLSTNGTGAVALGGVYYPSTALILTS